MVSLSHFLSLLFLSFVDDGIVLILDYNGNAYRQLHKRAASIWNLKSHIYIYIYIYICSWEYHFKVFLNPKVKDTEKVVLY